MVSFCDIRLSQLTEHTKKYGQYGIGLKKEWAIKNGLNPVSYINHNCTMFSYYDDRLREMNKELRELRSDADRDDYLIEKSKYRDLINVMRYMKNYEGELYRKDELKQKNYRFANECEWRYVPDINTKIIPIKIIRESFDNWKELANEKMWNHPESKLTFEYSDIKYIFVRSERMAGRLIKDLKELVNEDEYPLLVSKIFISRQVFDDL